MKEPDINYIIKLYESGESASEIARKTGFGLHIIKSRLVKAGIKLRSRTDAIRAKFSARFGKEDIDRMVSEYKAGRSAISLARHFGVASETIVKQISGLVEIRDAQASTRLSNAKNLGPAAEDDIVRRYESGESVATLSDAFSYHPGRVACTRYPNGSGIRGVLHRHGVQLRTGEEAHQQWWDDRRCPEIRRAHMRASQLAGAAMRERTLNVRMSPQEGMLYGALLAKGARCRQQRAVDVYNLDISFEELPIAIEVESGSAFAEGRVTFAQQRIKHLTDAGWAVVYVITGRRTLNPCALADKIMALADAAGRDKSVFGQYGVVDCEGNPLASARYKLDGVSRIAGF